MPHLSPFTAAAADISRSVIISCWYSHSTVKLKYGRCGLLKWAPEHLRNNDIPNRARKLLSSALDAHNSQEISISLAAHHGDFYFSSNGDIAQYACVVLFLKASGQGTESLILFSDIAKTVHGTNISRMERLKFFNIFRQQGKRQISILLIFPGRFVGYSLSIWA